MKTLNSLAFYALVTPAIAFGSTAALAQSSTSPDADMENQTTQQGFDREESSDERMQSSPDTGGEVDMIVQIYMSALPVSGMQASDLIGATVRTASDEDAGEVSDLIIDQDGRVVAVVVGVGGFLGMGEKRVAISWDEVTQGGTADELELQIDQTREELSLAPEYQMQ